MHHSLKPLLEPAAVKQGFIARLDVPAVPQWGFIGLKLSLEIIVCLINVTSSVAIIHQYLQRRRRSWGQLVHILQPCAWKLMGKVVLERSGNKNHWSDLQVLVTSQNEVDSPDVFGNVSWDVKSQTVATSEKWLQAEVWMRQNSRYLAKRPKPPLIKMKKKNSYYYLPLFVYLYIYIFLQSIQQPKSKTSDLISFWVFFFTFKLLLHENVAFNSFYISFILPQVKNNKTNICHFCKLLQNKILD